MLNWNKSHFIHEKFLIFDLVFEKITIFLFFQGYFLGNFQKNRSQKPSMLEEKQGQFWNLHRIPNKTLNPDFRFLFLLLFYFMFFSRLKKSNCNFYSKIFPHQKNKTKIKNRDSKFCAEFDADSKTVLVFFSSIDSFWLLFFWRFKNAFYRRGKCIYICIYWVLLGGFDTINASNQRTIWFCMLFQPSWFILYFIFSINSIVFYEIFYNDVTASRDVTYLFIDPDEICTAYVKLNSKHILFVRIFWFSIYFSR